MTWSSGCFRISLPVVKCSGASNGYLTGRTVQFHHFVNLQLMEHLSALHECTSDLLSSIKFGRRSCHVVLLMPS